MPAGVLLTEDNKEAVISFYVNRSGRILGEPQIVKKGPDPTLAESGVRAVMAAAPFPPLPPDFREPEQQVIVTFRAE